MALFNSPFAPKRTADGVERCPLLDEQQNIFAR
jgi:hypothetical protein